MMPAPSKASELLLLLYLLKKEFNQIGVDGRTKMQKIIYLLSREYPDLDFGFIGYHYGPYSKDLQNTLNRLVAYNLLYEEVEYVGNTRYSYELTTEAEAWADPFWESLNNAEKNRFLEISKKASRINKMTLNEILPIAYKQAEEEHLL